MKQAKKRSYFSYFAKALAVILAGTAAVGGTALYWRYQLAAVQASGECRSRLNVMEDWLGNPKHADASYEEIRSQLAFCCATDPAIDSAMILYDRETGKTYDSTELVWSSVRFRADNTKQIAKLKKAAPELAEQSAQDDGRFVIDNIIEDPERIKELTPLPRESYEYSLQIQDVYIRGKEAYPGKITVYSGKRPLLDKIFNLDLLNELNYLKDIEHDLPAGEGCLHFTRENTVAIPEDMIRADMLIYLPVGTKENSPAMKEVYRYMEDYNDHAASEYAFENRPKTAICTALTSTYYPEGKRADARYEIYYLAFYDFWQQYLPRLLFYTGIIFLIELLIAALIAKIMHMKHRKAYEMNEYRRTLTASFAHDLKTPLTAISGYAENLRDNIHTEKRESYADAILENTQYMDKIIADVLNLAKLERMQPTDQKPVDLKQLADDAIARFTEQIAAKNLTHSCAGSCTVKGNETLLAQAVGSLIDNAVRYAPEGGSIEIRATEKGLIIRNDAENLPDPATVCEPLVKGESARTSRSGSGMGLAIVRQIMQLHGFRFTVKAENGKFTAKIKI